METNDAASPRESEGLIVAQAKRGLIVVLCMHRSGSSLTAGILEKLGMSLGPFELLKGSPYNRHGYFEPVQFNDLNRRVLDWAFGFTDVAPLDPKKLAEFLDSGGVWPADRELPREWLEEGERITRALVESGPISGFKDPRTVLVWPFWRQVFEAIEGVEILPVMLARSPHEIALSICARGDGSMPYWSALDLVGLHFARMKAVADEFQEKPPVARFATPYFWDDLQRMVDHCGLAWDAEAAEQAYDPSCVHHLPAVVAHPAQDFYDELCGGDRANFDPEANALRLAEDARRSEAAMYRRLLRTQNQLKRSLGLAKRARRVSDTTDALINSALKGGRRLKRAWRKLRMRG